MATVITPRSFGNWNMDSMLINNINNEKPTIISGMTIGTTMALVKKFFFFYFPVFVVATAANVPKITAPEADINAIFKLVIMALTKSSSSKTS